MLNKFEIRTCVYFCHYTGNNVKAPHKHKLKILCIVVPIPIVLYTLTVGYKLAGTNRLLALTAK